MAHKRRPAVGNPGEASPPPAGTLLAVPLAACIAAVILVAGCATPPPHAPRSATPAPPTGCAGTYERLNPPAAGEKSAGSSSRGR